MALRTSKAVLVRLPPELHAAVKVKAASEERSLSQAIHDALRRYVDEGPRSDDPRSARPYTPGASFRG
jgi:hypothetical protein